MERNNSMFTRYAAFLAFAFALLAGPLALANSAASSSTSSSAAKSSSGSASSSSELQPAPRVRVSTNMGDFVIELYPDRAPFTVANFLRYVKEGQYTHTLFHRVVSNFVIQGGGYDASTSQVKPTHVAIPNESGNGLQNKRGTVGLARAAPAHSGNCQFYINLADNTDLDPLPTRWGYTVFGHVVEGEDVIERIGVTPTGAVPPFKSDSPLKPVVIDKIELVAVAANSDTRAIAPNTTPSPAVESPH
jgi:peptidyl-prolyl cis-trans isomerase A (cyclophilin A)